jgi:hypothetical protein
MTARHIRSYKEYIRNMTWELVLGYFKVSSPHLGVWGRPKNI